MFENNCNNSQKCQNSASVDGFLIQLSDNHKMHITINPVGSNLHIVFVPGHSNIKQPAQEIIEIWLFRKCVSWRMVAHILTCLII